MLGTSYQRNYTETLEFDKANNNSKWYDATKTEMDSINSYEVFKRHGKAQYDEKRKLLMHPKAFRKLELILFLQSSMMTDTKPDL